MVTITTKDVFHANTQPAPHVVSNGHETKEQCARTTRMSNVTGIASRRAGPNVAERLGINWGTNN